MDPLAGLFAASFVAPTLFPLPSEAALFAYLKAHPEHTALGVAVAMAAGRLSRYIVVAAFA